MTAIGGRTSALMSAFRIRFKEGLAYRTAAYAGILTQVFFGFMYIMIYMAFYRNSTEPSSISLRQLVTYTWLMQAFLMLVASWSYDRELMQMIVSGNVAYELLRPQSLYALWFVRNLAIRVSRVFLRFAPVIVVAVALPGDYRILPPASLAAFVLFVLALFLGTVLVIVYLLLGCIFAFYTISAEGIIWFMFILIDVLGGQLVPLAIFPEAVQKVLYMLPFAYISDFAFRVYSGNIPISEALTGTVVQAVWIGVLAAAGNLLLGRALKRVVVQGG